MRALKSLLKNFAAYWLAALQTFVLRHIYYEKNAFLKVAIATFKPQTSRMLKVAFLMAPKN